LMKLTDLEPHFLKIEDKRTYLRIDDIKQADGIQFLCPVCFERNKGKVGTHSIICWQSNVPQTFTPIPGRWEFLGTGYNDLTLRAGSSSISLDSKDEFKNPTGCRAHFHITNGEVLNAGGPGNY
jgi:hypothetical protein